MFAHVPYIQEVGHSKISVPNHITNEQQRAVPGKSDRSIVTTVTTDAIVHLLVRKVHHLGLVSRRGYLRRLGHKLDTEAAYETAYK